MRDDKTDLDPDARPGHGGEVHQVPPPGGAGMTTANGVTIADGQNSLKVGARGPILLQDHVLREKTFHFDHERIPERVIHARGFGAHGTFTCTRAIPDLTIAAPFQAEGTETPVFVRFSTVTGSRGSFDLARDVRGFAVKMYTKDGNWDLVGNNIPVFFIQDPIKFPDLVHAVKEEPDRGFPQAQSAHDTFWDFIVHMPESMHMIMWQMSDRTIPRSFRFMEGFGVHSFYFIGPDGQVKFVKFHWKPRLGLQSVLWDEAVKINGADPDYHRRDLWEAIRGGDYPEWDLCVQVFDQAFADTWDFDVLDSTKVIPEELVPAEPIGVLQLNRTVDNFFQETEQVAFCTQNLIPGIGNSDDPLLHGRNFSYLDTQLKRLGSPNFTQIPINRPRGCPVHNFFQDGHMQMQNRKGRINYEPNGFNEGARADPRTGYRDAPVPVSGGRERMRSDTFADHYSQARLFYLSQTVPEQRHIAEALIFELGKCEIPRIREQMVAHLLVIDGGLAADVAAGLGLARMPAPAPTDTPARTDLPLSMPLNMLSRPTTFEGRLLGVLVDDGHDANVLGELAFAALRAGARMKVVALRPGGARSRTGGLTKADMLLRGGKSVLFDAIAVLGGSGALAAHTATGDFLRDAWMHGKFIALHEADALVAAAGPGIIDDDGMVDLSAAGAPDFVQACAALRHWDRLARMKTEADTHHPVQTPEGVTA